MIKLTNILREAKVLSVFDFDDTLVKTDSWVYVTKDGKVIKKLDPGEFAVSKLGPGEEYDFRDFDRALRNPKLIKKNADLFIKQLEKARKASRGARKVTILTARRLGQPVTHFFKSMGLEVYTVPLGDANPEKKADWIEKQVAKGYDTVYFMDDSAKNVRAVEKRMKKYPNVRFTGKVIQ